MCSVFFFRGRHYYWNVETDEVSWFPPEHPKANVTVSANKLRAILAKSNARPTPEVAKYLYKNAPNITTVSCVLRFNVLRRILFWKNVSFFGSSLTNSPTNPRKSLSSRRRRSAIPCGNDLSVNMAVFRSKISAALAGRSAVIDRPRLPKRSIQWTRPRILKCRVVDGARGWKRAGKQRREWMLRPVDHSFSLGPVCVIAFFLQSWHQSTDQSVDRLIDWLIDWSIGRLIDWWLIDWLIEYDNLSSCVVVLVSRNGDALTVLFFFSDPSPGAILRRNAGITEKKKWKVTRRSPVLKGHQVPPFKVFFGSELSIQSLQYSV